MDSVIGKKVKYAFINGRYRTEGIGILINFYPIYNELYALVLCKDGTFLTPKFFEITLLDKEN